MVATGTVRSRRQPESCHLPLQGPRPLARMAPSQWALPLGMIMFPLVKSSVPPMLDALYQPIDLMELCLPLGYSAGEVVCYDEVLIVVGNESSLQAYHLMTRVMAADVRR